MFIPELVTVNRQIECSDWVRLGSPALRWDLSYLTAQDKSMRDMGFVIQRRGGHITGCRGDAYTLLLLSFHKGPTPPSVPVFTSHWFLSVLHYLYGVLVVHIHVASVCF